MNNNYFRITYNDIGIYEALKQEIFNNYTKEEWQSFKSSNNVNWLKAPVFYGDNNYSYFKELGFNMFMKKTYPLIIKYLKIKNIKIEKYTFDTKKLNLIYSDEYQIVIERSE